MFHKKSYFQTFCDIHRKASLLGSFFRSSLPVMLLGKGVLKICSTFTGEHPCQSVISMKLQNKFIEIIFLHGCSPVNLLHIFRKLFPNNTSGQLLLSFFNKVAGHLVYKFIKKRLHHRYFLVHT